MAARKVLLVAEGTLLARESLMCAVNLCQRTSADLLVLNVVACPKEHTYWLEVQRRLERERLEEAARNIDPLIAEAREEGVRVELVRQVGDMDAALAELARREAGMLAVIVGQAEPATARATAPRLARQPVRGLFERLEGLFGCPFVTVKARK
jgi:hypothetical protein